ncbi:MAG: SDR family oxidoreductase [Bernardetiaceae bacterium]
MSKIKNKTVLITGGASGIGKIMGELCLRKEGARRLIVWDINEAAMYAMAQELSTEGYEVLTYAVDVSDTEALIATARQVLEEVGVVDILFNNAGIVVGKEFADHQHGEIDKTIQINVLALMHLALELVPAMIEQGSGHIINIASAAGMLANPRMSVYAGSKWAVIGWSESLRLELEALKKDLHVTTVMPGYIKTGMFDGAKAPLLTPLLEPEDISKKIIQAVKDNETELKAPFIVNWIPLLKGVLPTRIFDEVADVLGVYTSMEDFKGRQSVALKESSK